jgi:hypothetical protein
MQRSDLYDESRAASMLGAVLLALFFTALFGLGLWILT